MPDTTQQALTAATILQGLLLGIVLGAIGQGIRIIPGLKQAGEAADPFNGSRLLVSLLIGAIAGALASLPLLSQLANLSKSVKCLMVDTMPSKKNIKNGAGIDLSPAAVAALDLAPPVMVSATWQWADEVPVAV